MVELIQAPRWKVALALGLVYVIWGSTYLAIRFAVETLPPLSMAGVRFLIAGSFLYGWARLRGDDAPRLSEWRAATIVGALLLLGGNGLVVWAEQRVDSGLTALLASTSPLWMVLLPWMSRGGRRPTGRVIAGVVLGFAGVGLLVRPGGAHGGVDFAGAGLLVLASICWAGGSLYARRSELPRSPVLATGIEMLTGGVLLLLAGAAFGEPARFGAAHVSLRSALAFGYLVVAAVIAFTAYIWVLRAVSPAVASTHSYVNPLVAVLLGWGLAGEPLTARTALAALIVASGVALITLAKPRAQAPVVSSASERSVSPVAIEPEVCVAE
ncbi:MAG TPA: EamA family transporter [Thermoanaerobaculia bacterium]|nr:EamA family transporter [Thermoanaerobaculia bacterium]